MTKKISLATSLNKAKVGDTTPSPKFVNGDKNEAPHEPEEFPPVGFFNLYRYTSNFDKFVLFIGTVCTVGTALCQPLNMLIFGDLTGDMVRFASEMYEAPDEQQAAKSLEQLEENIRMFAIYNTGIGVLLLVLSYLSTFFFNYVGITQGFKIRTLYLNSALNQDIAWYDKHQSGDFASRMTDDLSKLEEGLGEKIAMFMHFQFSFVALLILALTKGWLLALICLISLPVTMLAIGVVAVLTSKLAKKELDAYGEAGRIAEEALSGIRTVLAFGGQHKELSRYNDNLVFAKNNNIKRSLLGGIGFGLLWFFIYASYALAFWYGIGLVIEEKGVPEKDQVYTPGNMITVFFSVMMASMNFGMSSAYIEVFGIAKGAASKIFGVIDNAPIINASKGVGERAKTVKGNIIFNNVRFNYPNRPDVDILTGLNLNIKAGDTVALVGSSGCGKSTCIQMIQRFYDPLEGSITLDDNNLQDLDLTWLRSNIGVVGQEPVLFGTSIAENIKYGCQNATKDEIQRAARKANAHKFISALPQGYDTLVGERGAQLSGGQKQRIAIARALVKEPAILLLDEATSALDTNSEAQVQAALDNVSRECTTIIVAHRLSTIRGANRIVVINKGIAVEEGTHEELMKKQGEYFNLVTTQVSTDDVALNEKRVSVINNDMVDDVDAAKNSSSDFAEEKDAETPETSIWSIINMNKPETLEITIGCITSIIMGASTPIFAILFGDIIGIMADPDIDYIRSESNKYCLMFVITGVIAGISTFLQIYMFGIAGEKLTMRVRGQIFDAMLKQEIGWYDRKENGVGALCAKLSGEAALVQGATGQRVGTVFQSLATIGLSVGLSIYYEWRLGLVAIAFAPVIMATMFIQQRLMRNEGTGYRSSLEKSTKLAVEAVGNIRTVASLSSEKAIHTLYVQELSPYTKIALRNSHVRAFVIGMARSVVYFAFAACMYYGGYLIRNDGLFFGDVLKVSQAMIMGTASVASALAFAPNFQKGLIAATKVFKLLARQPKIADAANATSNTWEIGNIQYSKLHFSYPTRPSADVLKGLDLSVLNGKTVALVGPSGCGKSTIVQLLERYYDPKSGSVSVDKQDLKSIKMASLRSNLGIVSQEPNLFDRTIGENIKYGDNSREVSMEEVIAAATKANIHSFIAALPLGYDTSLGEKGAQLSGGQKQRVAIARALIRNPKVLLLDEATSALDTESEKVVQEALDQAKEGRTCITIAHRLTTIQDADVICVINEGVVFEMGTHAELLSQKGLYHKLHSLQSGNKK